MKLRYDEFIGDLADARGRLGELNGLLRGLKAPELLVSPLITKEAVFSSQIEGTQATLDEVFRADAEDRADVDTSIGRDVQEIRNYRLSMHQAVVELQHLPISTRLIQKLHATLLDSVRGANKDRRQFRRVQVYVGPHGAGIREATFVPPSANEIPRLISNWEQYVNGGLEKDPLIAAGVAHYQFEAIHPFLDGNGRIGRILIPIMLFNAELLRFPALFVSQFFDENRAGYYSRLKAVSSGGAWSDWLQFFLKAVSVTAQQASAVVMRIADLYDELLPEMMAVSARYGKRVHDVLFHNPCVSFSTIKAALPRVSVQTVYNIVARCCEKGILVEITGQKRNRVFRFQRLVNELQ